MTVSLLVIMVVLGAGPGDDPTAQATDRAAYEAAEKEAGGDARAQVRLALWCEAHGMTAERMKHLAAAVAADPAHALARGLMGLVAHDGKWERPEEVSREARDDPRQKALMEEYLQRRARTPDKADEQWKLATWCEQNGLKEQAVAHYHAVLRLDPRRDAVWKHLGFKKVGGRWIKPEWQEAARREADEQGRANKHWRPILERWRSGLSSREKSRRADAEAGLLGVTDPRAAPMVWAVFVARGAEGHKVAVRVLGQIDSPGSSRALALMALNSPVAEVRGDAIAILRNRDPRDYGPILVALLRERIRYEVRRVNGPGSRGELLIKGPDVNVDRLYSPPPLPFIPIRVGDSLAFDSAGLPVIDRFLGTSTIGVPVAGNSLASALAAVDQRLPQASPMLSNNLGLPPDIAARLNALRAQSMAVPVTVTQHTGPSRLPNGFALNPNNYRVSQNTAVSATESFNSWERIPIGQMMLQYQEAAQVAEMQLEADVRAIQAYNTAVQGSNQAVLQVLSGATGLDLGAERTSWVKWMADLLGYAPTLTTSSSRATPTVVEQVPLAYQPQPVPTETITQPSGFQITVNHWTSASNRFVHFPDCFGAGTPVRTLEGPRPIESLRPGDLVLTQDPRSAVLHYRAVVAIYHNPPQPTDKITTESGDAMAVTRIHWLWKAGKGWVMAHELKPGDRLRTLGGVATVKAVESDRVQPVFNLRVAEGESFFVGAAGVLAHDNSTINPVTEPFDAVGPLTAAAAPMSSSPRPRSMLGR